MPFYSSHTRCGKLINTLKSVIDSYGISSFRLSKMSSLSPTTTRKIYYDETYIPSPDVLERICLVLDVEPGDILKISSKMDSSVVVCSGV